MKTLVAILAGTAMMISAGAQAKFIERDSPNNATHQGMGTSIVSEVIDHNGYGYLAQQQTMNVESNGFYPTTTSLNVEYESRTASITTNHDIAQYLSVQ